MSTKPSIDEKEHARLRFAERQTENWTDLKLYVRKTNEKRNG